MNRARFYAALALLGGLIGLPAQAHLMVAQRGTLNLVNDGAYLVLALPVSAFTGVDDDGDGLLSGAELRAHGRDIEAQVLAGVQLSGGAGPLPLQGVMLNLSPRDETPAAPAAHIVVLGRYALGGAGPALRLKLRLFGTGADEQAQEITVTRGPETQRLLLAPGRDERELLPSAAAVFADHATQGAAHVLGGLDHLLFLLVVLAGGGGLGAVVAALSCFTAGHALTLVAGAWGGWTAPAALVEPAIAATVIGMALFDRWAQARAPGPPQAVRLGLVFGCALVHGLALAGAFNALGLDGSHRLLSLAGFNVGIEGAQLAVAAGAAALLAAAQHLRGAGVLAQGRRLAGLGAVLLGSVWLVQRVASFA